MEEIKEEIKGMYVTPIGRFNFQSFPLVDGKTYFLTDEQIEQLAKHECEWHIVEEIVADEDGNEAVLYNISLVSNVELQDELESEAKDKLRAKRTPLLAAFDIYKSNVAYGVVMETEDEHILIKEWYNAILDLNEVALDNVPECIGRYL